MREQQQRFSNETAETDGKLDFLLAYEVVFAYRYFCKLVLAANELSDNETEHSSRDRQTERQRHRSD